MNIPKAFKKPKISKPKISKPKISKITSSKTQKNRKQITPQQRNIETQLAEEEKSEKNNTNIKEKAIALGVKDLTVYEIGSSRIYIDPQIFEVKYESIDTTFIRCCMTAKELRGSIISHLKAIHQSTNRQILLRSLPQSYVFKCHNNPNPEQLREIRLNTSDFFDQSGIMTTSVVNEVLRAITDANKAFENLPKEQKDVILRMLEEQYSTYLHPDSIIRTVQAYTADSSQRLLALAIDPKLEEQLTRLISGYEDELKSKNIEEYMTWLVHANDPTRYSFSDLERTNLYLTSTFGQIERLFSIDIYHIIVTTLEGEGSVKSLEDIDIGDIFSGTPIPEGTSFIDVLQQIDAIESVELKSRLNYIYKCYFLLKSLCFILHDKPVNAFVKILLNYIVEPKAKYTRGKYLDIFEIIHTLIQIWVSGFTKGADHSATQKRCHDTADELTRYFTDIMKLHGIIVPEKLLVYSMPYSVFKNDKEQQQIAKEQLIRSNCKYGLADAVGNEFLDHLFTEGQEQQKLYTFNESLQDAAPPSRTNGPLTVIKSNIHIDSGLATNSATISTISVDLEKGDGVNNLARIEFINPFVLAEPVRFGNIAIFTLQNDTAQPFVLYYLDSEECFGGLDQTKLERYLPTHLENFRVNLNTSWGSSDFFNQFMTILDAGDEGKQKILFGVSYGRISQNDTIPLIAHLGLDMSKSARGRGAPQNILTLKWLAQNTESDVEDIVRVLLASFAKELGDQAKRNTIEIINRNPSLGGKGLLATVDTFLPHAFTNGICVVKAGNIEIYEQEGFRTIDRPTIINILKLLQKYEDYELLMSLVQRVLLPKLIGSVRQVIDILTPQIQRPDLARPPNVDIFKHVLLYSGILSELNKSRLLIDSATFHEIKRKYIENWQSPGFTDDISFMKRILFIGNIRDLFSIYEKDIDTYQSFFITYEYDGKTYTEKNLSTIIEKYSRYYYTNQSSFDFDNEINKILEEAPLFYLLKYWNEVTSQIIIIPRKTFGRSQPSYSPDDYIRAVAKKLSVFIVNYIDDVGAFISLITSFNDGLADKVSKLISETRPESSYDDVISSQVEYRIDYASNEDAQDIVDQDEPGVSVETDESNSQELGPPLPVPSIQTVVSHEDASDVEDGLSLGDEYMLSSSSYGGKSNNKNIYFNKKLTKKNSSRVRKTRKNTKRPKYIKKNATRRRR